MKYLSGSGLQYFYGKIKPMIDSKLPKTSVVNNLTTTTTGKALDATQGKALKDSVDKTVKKSDILNIESTATDKVPSCAYIKQKFDEQGTGTGAKLDYWISHGYLPDPDFAFSDGYVLENITWSEINSGIQNGFMNQLRLGDTKTVELTDGEVIEMQIVGLNVYGNNRATFLMKNLLQDNYPLWDVGTTNSVTGGYGGSTMRDRLQNIVFNKLPPDLQNVIKAKRIRSTTHYTSTDFDVYDKLWLPSIKEMFGVVHSTSANDYEDARYNHFPYFDTAEKRIKKKGSVNTAYPVLSMSTPSGSLTYIQVTADGSNSTTASSGNKSSSVVAFGFEI